MRFGSLCLGCDTEQRFKISWLFDGERTRSLYDVNFTGDRINSLLQPHYTREQFEKSYAWVFSTGTIITLAKKKIPASPDYGIAQFLVIIVEVVEMIILLAEIDCSDGSN